MTQPSSIISLAVVRATRQAQQAAQATPPAGPEPPPTPLHWRESQRGNWWTLDARSGIHFVIFENRRGWAGRVTMPSGEAWFENMPGMGTLAEAQTWAEGWLGMQCIVGAAETRV